MFYLSKFLTYWILPPGLIIVLLTITIFLIRKRSKKGVLVGILTVLFIYGISIEPVKNLLLRPLEDEFPFPDNLKNIKCDAIVILGSGSIYNSPDEYGKNAPTDTELKRLYMGYRLWKALKKPIVVSGGDVFDRSDESEADVMSRTLIRLGVSPEYIIKEKNSKNTYENVRNIKEILDEHEWNKVCLVTSAYHMPRSVYVFQSFYIPVEPVPTDYLVNRTSYKWVSYLPTLQSFYGSVKAIREYIGIFYYTFRYGV